jgi:predicted RNase H-like nuclease (RuvC/YqgF family)
MFSTGWDKSTHVFIHIIKGAIMGQARKIPKKKKETKEEVLKKEVTAAVNRRTTAKINEVKALVEGVEERVNEHFKHHEEGSEHTHSKLENRVDEIERRLTSMFEDLRMEIEKIRRERGGTADEEGQPPSHF